MAAEVLAGSADEEDDAERRKSRKDKKVSAILHSEYPVRYWDADLGPGQPRIFAVEPGPDKDRGKPGTVDATAPLALRNLTPDAGPRLREAESVVSPDGRTIYTSLHQAAGQGGQPLGAGGRGRRLRQQQGPARPAKA